MSSSTRENPIIRRMINLPRNILIGCSRAINQGIDLISPPGRINHLHHPHQNHQYLQQPSNQLPSQNPNPNFPHDNEWAFLTTFEQQHGAMHPFFYACRFKDALKMGEDERKLMFMYIHAPEHPFTQSFCRETLCSEVVVQFLDANFVCWGGLDGVGEGFQMASALRVSSFPFCAVVGSSGGDNLAVLQQLEGPVSPAELLEILQRTIEEQGPAFGSGRAYKHEDKRRDDSRLREEQDVAYIAALRIDQEKEEVKNKTHCSENKVPEPQKTKAKPATTKSETSQKANTSGSKKADQVTQILIRFSNGERREQSFLSTDKIQSIYRYIDSLGLPGIANYRLISNFPRNVYGADQMGMTLKKAGLHHKASIFVELI